MPDTAPVDRIVVPVTAGEAAAPALDVATALAERWQVPVEVLHVAPPSGAGSAAAAAPDAGQRHTVPYGSVARTAVEAAGPGGLVCLATHGVERAHALVHSVTDDVLRSATGPVLLVGPRVPAGGRTGGAVVACLAEPGTAPASVALARRWARSTGGPLWLVEVTAPGRAPAVLAAGAGAHGPADRVAVLTDDDAARALADLAAREPVAALVTVTHARTGWPRVLAGSVTVATARRAPCPVLVGRAT